MSKITFRADDDLVTELEAFDASKSEVMRDALRTYLDVHACEEPSSSPSASTSTRNAADSHVSSSSSPAPSHSQPTIDDLVRERVDERLAHHLANRESQDVNVSVTLEGADVTTAPDSQSERKTNARKTDFEDSSDTDHECGQCGETLDDDHVYCPNCGEKASKRAFCDCGDEVRSDWAFCPSCGRRTPAADVLDSR